MIENQRIVVMKFVSRHKLLFSSLLLIWVAGMFFSLMLMGKSSTKIQYERQLEPLLHHLQHNRLPSLLSFKMYKALRYCNPPNDISIGHEGRIPANYTLDLVAIVIRHGDRSPLRPVRNQSIINCGVEKNHPLLRNYLSTLKTVQRHSKKRYPFTTFPLHPNEKRCSTAQMTMVGALQHLQLGYLLNKIYNGRFKLLTNEWTSNNLKIYSTVYSRTYQSALAFLFGFLPGFDFNRLKIVPSSDTKFCLNDVYCKCALLDHLQKLMNRKMQRLVDLHPAVVGLVHRLNPIVKLHPNHSDITTVMAMFDSLMAYVCHGSHLPCIPNSHNCVTVDHVRNVIAFLDWEGRQFVEDSTHKKYSWLKVQGLLTNLINHIQDVVNSRTNQRLILYSGHEVTLIPLISTLGLDDGTIPPYASRLVFELYSTNGIGSSAGKRKHIVRVLYNGKDLTKYTVFCKSYYKPTVGPKSSFSDFCPLESFTDFVRKEFYQRMNATTFQSACNLAQITRDPYDFKYYHDKDVY